MMNDLRLALRTLSKTPGVVLVVVLCLGLSVGANTTIFSLTSAIFLRPLPVHEPDRLVRLYSAWDEYRFRSSSYPEYAALSSHTNVFTGVTAFRSTRVSIGQGADATLERAMTATGNYFTVLGVTPALGRLFTPADDRAGADPVVVLSYAYWQGRLGADPAVVSRTLHISGKPHTIIGVTPQGFHGVEPDMEVAALFPLMAYRQALAPSDEPLTQGWHAFAMVGRLHGVVSIEQARAAAGSAARTVADAYGGEWQELGFTVVPGGTLANMEASDEIRVVFLLLNSVVALVLLIACANIANILLARGTNRRREIAIRLALGAGRPRLIRQLLVESVLLSLAGGLAGLVLAFWSTDLLRAFDLPAAIDPTPDGRVLFYALVVAVTTGLVFGTVPALMATRVTMADTLKQSTRLGAPVRSWLRSSLVVSQISVSVLLLVLAGLFLRTIHHLRNADVGIIEQGMLAAELDFRTLDLSEEQGRLLADRIQERIAALPGVEAATLSSTVPSGSRQTSTLATLPEHETHRTQEVWISTNTIGPAYLSTLGVPLVRGRPLTREDRAGRPLVTVVNQAFASRFFPDVDALGKHIRVDNLTWEVVGIMHDVRYESAGYEAEPGMLISYHQQ